MIVLQERLRSEPGGKLALPLGSLFRYPNSDMAAIADIGKKRGRPSVGSTGVLVKLPPDQLAALDHWISAQPERPSRPEAIRRILERSLADNG